MQLFSVSVQALVMLYCNDVPLRPISRAGAAWGTKVEGLFCSLKLVLPPWSTPLFTCRGMVARTGSKAIYIMSLSQLPS